MKLLLVFALCGVTCCLAGPSCSSDELRKCYPLPAPHIPVESEDIQLANICRENKCFLHIYERCGSQGFTDKPFPVKGYRRVVNAFCGRSNPLRKNVKDVLLHQTPENKYLFDIYRKIYKNKLSLCHLLSEGFLKYKDMLLQLSENPVQYLENMKCLRSATSDDNMEKIVKMCDIVDRPKEESCRKIPDGYKCAVDYIAKECGKDAGDVFQVAILPYFDPYDCLSSSHTYDF